MKWLTHIPSPPIKCFDKRAILAKAGKAAKRPALRNECRPVWKSLSFHIFLVGIHSRSPISAGPACFSVLSTSSNTHSLICQSYILCSYRKTNNFFKKLQETTSSSNFPLKYFFPIQTPTRNRALTKTLPEKCSSNQ